MEISKESVHFLSQIIHFPAQEIVNLINNPKYTVFSVKKGQKKRTFHVPSDELKQLQTLVLENIFSKHFTISDAAHCSVKKRSSVTNATIHKKSLYFFKVDFEKAFDKATSQQVYKAILNQLQNTHFFNNTNYQEITLILTKICVFNNQIPQGAPTSPFVFNCVCLELDKIFSDFSKTEKYIYTRYMDDITISSQKPIDEESRDAMITIIKSQGFFVNSTKTHYSQLTDFYQPKITGIRICKNQLSIGREEIEKYRSTIHNSLKTNLASSSEIFGIIGWVIFVERKIPSRLQKPFFNFLQTHHPNKIQNYKRYLDQIGISR